MVSARLREVEKEIDEYYTISPLADESFGTSAIHLLSVGEEMLLRHMLDNPEMLRSDQEALADNIINFMNPGIGWLWQSCKFLDKDEAQFQARLWDPSVQMFEIASNYQAFESAFTYASHGLCNLELAGNRILTSGAMREGSVYDAYDRICDLKQKVLPVLDELQPNEQGKAFVQCLRSTLRAVGDSFKYTFSPQLLARANEALGPSLDARFRLPIEWKFALFDLEQFGKVAKTIWLMTFIHLQARLIASMGGCPHNCLKNAILRMKEEELIARVVRYSGVPRDAVVAIIGYLSYGGYRQRKPDPALQPLIRLDNSTFALAPSIIVNSSLERNMMVLINRVPESLAIYSALSFQREDEMRRQILSALRDSQITSWNGTLTEWDRTGEIDLVLISQVEKACLILELKSFLAPAEPRELINRSEEIAKGISQIRDRREKFATTPEPLLSALGVTREFSVNWAVISENSIGCGYVQVPDVPVVQRAHFLEHLLKNVSLLSTCEWMERRQYLPVKDRDFSEVPQEARVGSWLVE